MTPQVKRAAAATNCGGPMLVAVQSYSPSNLSLLIPFCNAAPRRAGFAKHSRPHEALLCRNQEGVNV